MRSSTPRRGVVVVGVDSTPESVFAARYAIGHAHAQNCDVSLVHAYGHPLAQTPYGRLDPVRLKRQAWAVIDSVAGQIHPPGDVRVDRRIENGSVTDVLADASDGARLVVVGHRTKGWGERLLTGSVASKLTRTTRAPLIMVPVVEIRDWSSDAPVAVALDGATPEHHLLDFAFEYARTTGRALSVVHAGDGRGALELARRRTGISALLAEWQARYPEVAVSTQYVSVEPDESLTLASHHAALLVLGRPRSPIWLDPWIGSVARAVMKSTACPIAIVPEGRSTTPSGLADGAQQDASVS